MTPTGAGHPSLEKSGLSRRAFFKAFGGGIFGFGLAGALGVKYAREVEPYMLQLEQVDLPLLPPVSGLDGTKIVCLSDFHLHPYTQIDLIEDCVRQVNRLGADIVCLLGDYVFDRADAIIELAPVLAQIQARYGRWSILGNHDLWTDAHLVASTLEENGIPVLANEHVKLDLPGGTILLAGLEDGWSGNPDLGMALPEDTEGTTVILMMHEPDFADRYHSDGRIDLQLSGHTHGGQVRLPGIGAPFLPRHGQKYDQGLYELGSMWLYTTRGIGVIGPPLRFNCRPEITLLTLRNAAPG
jgi:predicted MPP superfamily phosphohydrolase